MRALLIRVCPKFDRYFCRLERCASKRRNSDSGLSPKEPAISSRSLFFIDSRPVFSVRGQWSIASSGRNAVRKSLICAPVDATCLVDSDQGV